MHFTILLSLVYSLLLLNVEASPNPFTPKAYVIRYWKTHITNHLPEPAFLFQKASPLTAADYAAFSKLADNHQSLSDHLPTFCRKAHLFCLPNLSSTKPKPKDQKAVDFTAYHNKNFSNYGKGNLGDVDSFTTYSDDDNVVTDNFKRYSRESISRRDNFTSYDREVNIADESFTSYAASSTGGKGSFTSYSKEVNVPNLHFTSYSVDSNGRRQTFKDYTNNTNSGAETFASYGRNANGAQNDFNSYGRNANVMDSTFKKYGATGNGATDSFHSYGAETNDPQNHFKSYSKGGNGAVESFKGYRTGSNVGSDDFRSYGIGSSSVKVNFKNYGQHVTDGSSKFSGYAKNASDQHVDFQLYGTNSTFKGYAKNGVNFTSYRNGTSSVPKKWTAALGRFFREEMLKSGTVMAMPDITDKMPKRSFLPRAIATKLPFSTGRVAVLKKIFHASMEGILVSSLKECEREASAGETKRCVASIEDMIDFSTSVLGKNVAVHTTNNTRGSNGEIMIGEVRGINGGNVTKSVSCHQSLFPYLVYYCHSVPKVRVYKADILEPQSKVKINEGVAICHLDTSAWSPGHGAFVALGPGPGKIEVCHWIFENDMTWTRR